MNTTQEDLRLIERLVMDALHRDEITPAIAESRGGILREAIDRLREAYDCGEAPRMNGTLAVHFGARL